MVVCCMYKHSDIIRHNRATLPPGLVLCPRASLMNRMLPSNCTCCVWYCLLLSQVILPLITWWWFTQSPLYSPKYMPRFSPCEKLSHVDIWVQIEVNCMHVSGGIYSTSSCKVCNIESSLVLQHTLGTLKHIGLLRRWSVNPHMIVVESGVMYQLPIHFTD